MIKPVDVDAYISVKHSVTTSVARFINLYGSIRLDLVVKRLFSSNIRVSIWPASSPPLPLTSSTTSWSLSVGKFNKAMCLITYFYLSFLLFEEKFNNLLG
jgi:hypothetical protein